jgi:dolichol-phosphate mannosyltransferase
MIAVVIPCYKVSQHIIQLLSAIGDEVSHILVVDDCCPENSGKLVESECNDPRVTVIYHEENKGVGGAVKTGYQHAMNLDVKAIVKLDGDYQMDPSLIPHIAAPVVSGEADYHKGNRFYNVDVVRTMPPLRLFGNTMLSFMTKLSSGYWSLFDPTNGFTCISPKALAYLPLDYIADRYFFESDMLFRLNILRAVVKDMPMSATYADEESNMNIGSEIPIFMAKNTSNFFKRILYNYFIRDFSYASLELVVGTILILFGSIYGGINWIGHTRADSFASAGTVMISGLPIILGLQMFLGFLQNDISNQPTEAFQRKIADIAGHGKKE